VFKGLELHAHPSVSVYLILYVKYSRFEGFSCQLYFFWNEGVRWFEGLTCGFAEVFEGFG